MFLPPKYLVSLLKRSQQGLNHSLAEPYPSIFVYILLKGQLQILYLFFTVLGLTISGFAQKSIYLEGKRLSPPGPLLGAGFTILDFRSLPGLKVDSLNSNQFIMQKDSVLFRGPGSYAFKTLPYGTQEPLLLSENPCEGAYGCTYTLRHLADKPYLTILNPSLGNTKPGSYHKTSFSPQPTLYLFGSTSDSLLWKITDPLGFSHIIKGGAFLEPNQWVLSQPGLWSFEVQGNMGFLQPKPDSAQLYLLLVQNSTSIRAWTSADQNMDRVRNYSRVWQTDSSVLQPGNAWGDLPQFTEGTRSPLSLNFEHVKGGSSGCHITTGNLASQEPTSYDEARKGKNMEEYDVLRLQIRTSSKLPLYIALQDSWGKNSPGFPLQMALPLSTQWREIHLPLARLKTDQIDIKNIRSVVLYVPHNAPTEKGTFLVDSIAFLKSGHLTWFSQDDNNNGVLDFSSSWMGGESKVQVEPHFKNIPLSTEGYNDSSSILFSVDHKESGYAGINIYTGQPMGTEPQTALSAQSGKPIHDSLLGLSFFTKSHSFAQYRISLTDNKSNHSATIELQHKGSPSWQHVFIPKILLSNGAVQLNWKGIRTLNFWVDPKDPTQKFELLLDEIKFILP